MSQLSYDDEDYYFQISDELESDKEFVLIIYDIVDNRKRVKLAKLLSGYGTVSYTHLDVYKRQVSDRSFCCFWICAMYRECIQKRSGGELYRVIQENE